VAADAAHKKVSPVPAPGEDEEKRQLTIDLDEAIGNHLATRRADAPDVLGQNALAIGNTDDKTEDKHASDDLGSRPGVERVGSRRQAEQVRIIALQVPHVKNPLGDKAAVGPVDIPG